MKTLLMRPGSLIRRLWCAAAAVAAIALVLPGHAAAERLPVLDSPLTVAAEALDAPFVRLTIDAELLDMLDRAGAAVVESVPIAPDEWVDMRLERVEVFTDNAILRVNTADGVRTLPRPSTRVFRGTVLGEEGSAAFFSFSESLGAVGFISSEAGEHVLSSGPVGGGHPPVIYRVERDAVEALNLLWHGCSAGELAHEHALVPEGLAGGFDGPGERGGPPCRVAEIAWDTDEDFLNDMFNGDAEAATAYIELLTGANSEIYSRDVNTRMVISYLKLWETGQPWTADSVTGLLFEFRDFWRDNRQDVDRTLAHILSPRPLGGGVAWVDRLCSRRFGYSASAHINGFFPYPLQDNHGQNWDMMVTAHEMGHNFGTLHTHDGYDPPIDGCGSNDCTNANQGTIMSYCHICSGGMSNIRLRFHPRVIDRILDRLDATSCDLTGHAACEECIADWNGDGEVDINDFFAYLDDFESGDPRADLNEDGEIDINDFFLFLTEYEAGC